MRFVCNRVLIFAIVLVGLAVSVGAEVYPADAGPFVGDWKGLWSKGEDKFPNIGAQVIAMGNDEYQIRLVPKLYQRTPPFGIVKATEKDGKLVIEDEELFGEISGGKFTGGRNDGKSVFAMKRFELVSPTMGAKPPKGAIVLFDGTNFDAWRPFKEGKSWTLLGNGAMQANPDAGSLVSKEEFGDVRLHVEFRLPLLPEKRSQARGNSGVRLQGIFEVQVLDSYGLEGYWNECGALYKVSAPYVNMCAPPLKWQTYDIEFRTARFDASGKLLEKPRMTVKHNGVYVQRDHELPHGTSYSAAATPSMPKQIAGSIKLQSHGNEVQYRNIWLVDRSEK